MKTKNFRGLLVWQRSMTLAREIYVVTYDFPRSETLRFDQPIVPIGCFRPQ